jgi:Fe-S-cluster containining protein
MNPDPLLQPLHLGRQTFPGIWRAMMPAALLDLRFPDERKATCMSCPKACHEAWRPDYRCCTYHPRISNFLLGLACRTADGERAVDDLLQRGMVLPEGMHSSPRQWLDFVDDDYHELYGKSQKVLCPMLDTASGYCRVHAFRNSVCSTYFCTKDHGHAGEVFWSQIQTLGTQLEMRLAQWALREVGFDLDASLRALDELAPHLAQASQPQGWHPEALKKIWGKGWGHEKEILLACAAVIHKHQDQLWSLAQQETIQEAQLFDQALMNAVPDEQKEGVDEDDAEYEEVLDLSALWEDCLTAHDALWADPEGLFVLSALVSFVPHEQSFSLEYRFQNPARSLYFRLDLNAEQKALLESFQTPAPLKAQSSDAQDFLREMMHRNVLRPLV